MSEPRAIATGFFFPGPPVTSTSDSDRVLLPPPPVTSTSDSDWVLRLPPVKVRQIIALMIQHIVAGFGDALLVPQISFASFVGPRRMLLIPQAVFAKLARRVRLQSDQSILRPFISNPDSNVDMVGANVDSKQDPAAFLACVSNRTLNRLSLGRRQNNGRVEEKFFAVFPPVAVGRDPGRTVVVVMAVNRSALVTVKPRSIAWKVKKTASGMSVLFHIAR